MCGVAGILYRTPKAYDQPVGRTLLTMAACLQHRGSDSAGVAVYAKPERHTRIQVAWPAGAAPPEPREILAAGGGLLSQLQLETGGFRAVVATHEAGCGRRAGEEPGTPIPWRDGDRLRTVAVHP